MDSLSLNRSRDVQGKVIELQSIILSAQSSALAAKSEQSAMIQRISDLEKEIARVKAWEETKQRYELHQPVRGTFVYALKDQSDATEPPHWICAHCYEDGRRSILQFQKQDYSYRYHACPHCRAEFCTGPGKKAGPVIA